MSDIHALQGPAGQLCASLFFVGPVTPPLHPFRPAPTKTNDFTVTKRNAASARGAKRAELQKTKDDLDRQWAELQAEGRRESDRFANSPIVEPPINDPTYDDWVAYNVWLDKVGKVTKPRTRIEHQLELLDNLPKPGFPPNPDRDRDIKYRTFWQKCVDVCRGDTDRARKQFLRDGPEKLKVMDGTLKNALSRLKRTAAKIKFHATYLA